ncbi:MAG: sensor histidine kinase [Bacteroidetes bacterium]|nr:sensor histidine kinase [Bacteroidota bacterium]
MAVAYDFNTDSFKSIKTFEEFIMEFKYSIANPRIRSIKSIIQYILNDLKFTLKEKQKIEIIEIGGCCAKVPKDAFVFVIHNLIKNALIKGKSPKVEIIIDKYNLKIKCYGIVIPKLDLDILFSINCNKSENWETVGLGLWAKIVVANYKGKIWCKSNEIGDTYTEYDFRFPILFRNTVTKAEYKEFEEECIREIKQEHTNEIIIKMLKDGLPIKEIESYKIASKKEIMKLKNRL